MLPLKTSVIQSDSIPERQTKIQEDSSVTGSLLLLIKVLELLVCIRYNLLVWHATQTISSCHRTTKALISNERTGAFRHLERKTEQNKTKRDAEAFMLLFLSGWEGERYNYSFSAQYYYQWVRRAIMQSSLRRNKPMHQGELTSWKAQENTFYTKQTNKTNTQQSELTAHWHRLLQEIVESPPWRYSKSSGHDPEQSARSLV